LQWTAMRELGKQANGGECTDRLGRGCRAKGLGVADHALGRLVVDDEGLEMSVTVLEGRAHAFMLPLSASPCRSSITSFRINSTGAAYSLASVSAISSTLLLPSQSLSTATAISSGVRIRSGASKT